MVLMFAGALLATLNLALGAPANDILAQLVRESPVCFHAALPKSHVSEEIFDAWLDRLINRDWSMPTTPTLAYDPVRYTGKGTRFVNAGFKGASTASYDPRHRILLACEFYSSGAALYVIANVPPPPFPVAVADLTGFQTASGIRLGSTVDAVRRVYGSAPLVLFRPGHAGLGYARYIREPEPKAAPAAAPTAAFTPTPFGIWTWFEIRAGRVVAIERSAGF